VDFQDLEGYALVTGGTGGIGSAVCRLLAERGSKVAFTYFQNEEASRELEATLGSFGKVPLSRSLDLRDVDAISTFCEFLEEKGGIHTLVHTVGPQVPQTHLSKISPALFKEHVELEINGFFNAVHAGLPYLRASKGSIIAVTTAATGRYPIRDGLSAGPKAAVEMLIRGLAAEEGKYGVRANAVGPGMLSDGMAEELIAKGEYSQKDLDVATQNIPLRRFGKANDVAEAVCFLASERANYISGQILNIDGGYTA
tara:strand:- start:1026 stop:1790 length:765 start_codon:yes stop_codon:yes gene_type:complete